MKKKKINYSITCGVKGKTVLKRVNGWLLSEEFGGIGISKTTFANGKYAYDMTWLKYGTVISYYKYRFKRIKDITDEVMEEAREDIKKQMEKIMSPEFEKYKKTDYYKKVHEVMKFYEDENNLYKYGWI